MAQHWLKSAAARDLPLHRVLRKTEQEAFRTFVRARWGERGTPWCPHCGVDGAYQLARRGRRVVGNRFKCRDRACLREFTVTTNTVFWQHKLSFRRLLFVAALAVSSVKGKAALQVAREAGVAPKTAWVLLMKIREAVRAEILAAPAMEGIVEMDGAHFGAKARPANRAVDRADARLVANRPPSDEQTVVAVRQRAFDGLPDRVFVAVTPGERHAHARSIVRRKLARDAVLLTDDHRAYEGLGDLNATFRVPHRGAYALSPELHTNLAESFFARLRRGERGIHHRVAGKYLELYAAMAAWHENHRRVPFSEQLERLLATALRQPVSRALCGYWQGNYPEEAFGWEIEDDWGGDDGGGDPAGAAAPAVPPGG